MQEQLALNIACATPPRPYPFFSNATGPADKQKRLEKGWQCPVGYDGECLSLTCEVPGCEVEICLFIAVSPSVRPEEKQYKKRLGEHFNTNKAEKAMTAWTRHMVNSHDVSQNVKTTLAVCGREADLCPTLH